MHVKRPLPSPDREGKPMGNRSRGALAAVGIVSLWIAACSSSPVPTPSPTSTSAPTVVSTPVPTGSPVATGPIVEGKYLSEPNDVAAIVARIKGDTKLTDTERTEWVNTYANLPPTQVVGLEFNNGEFTETATGASGDDVGARGRYAVGPDGKTLVLAGIGSFTITPTGNGFALELAKQELPGEVEALVASILFASSPFTLERPITQAIPDGTYVGRTIQVGAVIAAIQADKKLSSPEKTALHAALDIQGASTFTPTLELQAGTFAQGEQLDHGQTIVGSRGSYAFPDAVTLVLQEQSVETFAVTWADGGFSLKHVPGIPNEFDALVTAFLFESTFAPVP